MYGNSTEYTGIGPVSNQTLPSLYQGMGNWIGMVNALTLSAARSPTR